MYSSSSLFKTRISAHFVNAYLAEGEKVTIEGWLTFYDEKERTWKPLDGKVVFYLDGKEIGSANAILGQFSFSFTSPVIGKHRIDIKFKADGYEPSYKSMSFEVVEGEKKRELLKFVKIIFVLILVFSLAILLTVFFL